MKYEKGHKQSNTGRTHFKKGYKHSEEWKKTMSEKMSGVNNYNYGKHLSEEHKNKLSKSHKGQQTGEDNNMWKGGITALNDKIRKTKDHREWANNIYKRDNYTCQECGIKCRAKNIIAHHIKPFADYPEIRFDINNGITLCRSCHKKIHKEIGIKTRFKTSLIFV
jgi:5-methylcytosine-specific restriction endonuclease McrA